MTPYRIALLCNNRMALQAIGQLVFTRMLCAVVIPADNKDLVQECTQALQGGVPLLTIHKEQLTDTLALLHTRYKADAVFLMTFPWRIPAQGLGIFPDRVFNFHYGLLPEMRGVDPVFESIRQQKSESGVTVHFATAKLDSGPVVARRTLPLENNITHGLLCAKLGMLAAQLCTETWMSELVAGRTPASVPQPETGAVYYGRPQLKDVVIDWMQMDGKTIQALARACNPWNKGVYTAVKGWNLRVCSFSLAGQPPPAGSVPGSVVGRADGRGIGIACKDGTTIYPELIYTDEGIFSGEQLLAFGIRIGDRFTNIL